MSTTPRSVRLRVSFEYVMSPSNWSIERESHMNPANWCASCAPKVIERLRAELAAERRDFAAFRETAAELHNELAAAKAEIREVHDALRDQIPYVTPGQTTTGFRAREAARLLAAANERAERAEAEVLRLRTAHVVAQDVARDALRPAAPAEEEA